MYLLYFLPNLADIKKNSSIENIITKSTAFHIVSRPLLCNINALITKRENKTPCLKDMITFSKENIFLYLKNLTIKPISEKVVLSARNKLI